MDEKKMKKYESPSTKKTQVELEEGVCATGSEASIKPSEDGNHNVEVPDYISIENEISFD